MYRPLHKFGTLISIHEFLALHWCCAKGSNKWLECILYANPISNSDVRCYPRIGSFGTWIHLNYNINLNSLKTQRNVLRATFTFTSNKIENELAKETHDIKQFSVL